MRFDGVIQTWNDERGFGFIEASQGGDPVFVHIKAFASRQARPLTGQRVTFEVELNGEGKKRAKNVEAFRRARRAASPRRNSPAQWGTLSLFAIPLLLVVYTAAHMVWRVSAWFAFAYVAGSVVAFVVYAVDKQAAVASHWRVSENTLHVIALAGGWPGALVAQQVLRHKSNKAAFRSAFWGTVVMNMFAFIAIHALGLTGLRG